MYRVPYTGTHTLNLNERVRCGDHEPINFNDLSSIRHPVQIIQNRNGRIDPNGFQYGSGIYELDSLEQLYRRGHQSDPLTRIAWDWDNVDEVEWEEKPNQSHEGYVQGTINRLQNLRTAQHNEHLQLQEYAGRNFWRRHVIPRAGDGAVRVRDPEEERLALLYGGLAGVEQQVIARDRRIQERLRLEGGEAVEARMQPLGHGEGEDGVQFIEILDDE